jgi:hypothetical protein
MSEFSQKKIRIRQERVRNFAVGGTMIVRVNYLQLFTRFPLVQNFHMVLILNYMQLLCRG